MKINLLFVGTLFFLQPLFSMHIVQRRIVPIAHATGGLYISKKGLSSCIGCECVKNFKYESTLKYSMCDDLIEKRITLFENIYDSLRYKKILQAEGRWPEKEGSLLEQELQSILYCPKFKTCARKVHYAELFTGTATLLSGLTLIGAMAASFITNDPSFTVIYCVIINSLFGYPFAQLQEYKKILTNIAHRDVQKCDYLYVAFKDAQLKMKE